MKFPRLILENFLAVGELDLDLADQGLFAITGVNEDNTAAISNGSGKSSVPDGLCWTAFGTTAREATGDEVINTARGKNTRGQLYIDDDGDMWRITRHRKHSTEKNKLILEHLVAGDWKDETKGTTQMTQAAIEKLLGCSYTVFKAAIYAGQEQMPDLPRATDKELKLLVEEAAGTDILAECHDVAKKHRDVAEAERNRIQIGIDKMGELIAAKRTQIEDAVERQVTWKVANEAATKALAAEVRSIKAEIDELLPDYDTARIAAIATEVEALKARSAGTTAERAKERELVETTRTTENALRSAQNAFETASRATNNARSKLSNITSVVGTDCDECGKTYSAEDVADATRIAEENVRKLTEAESKALKAIAPAQRTHDKAEAALTAFRKSMTDTSATTAEILKLQNESKVIEAVGRTIDSKKALAKTKAEQYKAKKDEINPFDALIEKSKEELIKLETDKKKLDAAFLVAVENLSYWQDQVFIFSATGVRAQILDDVTPFLNDATAHYLGSLADGDIEAVWTTLTPSKDGSKMTEKFSIAVESKEGATSFRLLSGGEKRKVRVACALALQDLVASRATKPMKLWVGDEVDDALDAAGLERLMGVLEEKARERGTVLIISHNDISDYVRRTLTDVKRGHVAHIEA